MPICFVPLILRRCDVRPGTSHSSGFRLPARSPACRNLVRRAGASAKAGVPRIWAFLSILNKDHFFKNLLLVQIPVIGLVLNSDPVPVLA